ncbi:hypothetical protein PTSG_11534 [Salpingoeca rosetta]|uniref:C2H2-type domain-containing protein n=1 Tax=Salpingoeca rosetta (strain ATCC 50818 / BSB-021) TaxID=946362 RepID=F2TVG0_SALR5|nr:uncharacterized protein PTSG_11534 [Salpingoeca rosetta]EGD72056.1 hypothetical protein PTSG_11534 [Salpingoeca rosetta]|eukprot:XP_004998628.1 hypothetical protein PTSG_11534 [Salpingoeca rosetta]
MVDHDNDADETVLDDESRLRENDHSATVEGASSAGTVGPSTCNSKKEMMMSGSGAQGKARRNELTDCSYDVGERQAARSTGPRGHRTKKKRSSVSAKKGAHKHDGDASGADSKARAHGRHRHRRNQKAQQQQQPDAADEAHDRKCPFPPDSTTGHFSCPHEGCGRTFTLRRNLLRHMKTHDGVKKFKCDVPGCTAAFFRRSDLKQHMITHTNEKAFVCSFPGCGKCFARRSDCKCLYTVTSSVLTPQY